MVDILDKPQEKTSLSDNKAFEERKILEELQIYRRGVELLASQKSAEIHSNSGPGHASVVMETIFDNATKVNIFGGNFDNRVCYNERSSYCESLEDFLLRGGIINVVLNRYDWRTYNKTLDVLKMFSAVEKFKQNIVVKTTTYKLEAEGKEVHIATFDGKGFRYEYDINNFAARFSFNQPDITELYDKVFYSVFNDESKSTIKDLSVLPF